MAGLINSIPGTPGLTQTTQPDPLVPTPPAQPAQAPTTTYTPTTLPTPKAWENTPDQTVAGQVKNIIAENSPLTQQAETATKQQFNARGLINSSMAVQAGQNAVYNAALPIATADAANASKQVGYSVDQINQAAVKNQDTQTQVGLNNAQSANQVATANMNADNQVKIKQLDSTQQEHLAQIANENKNLIQNSSVASTAYNTYANTLFNNAGNVNMDRAARYQADLNAFHIYQQQVSLAAVLTGVPDVSSQLVFTEVQ